MFVYTDNPQVVKELKKAMLDADVTQVEVATAMGLSKQRLSTVLHRKFLGFKDTSKILDAFGYDLVIDFVKRPDSGKKK